ncbi:Conserved hypothetical protein [Clostridium acetobutylicum EA 2018]|uniref:Uncharacterized protein n=1 Tax=Clostridium acetobutylicum (strain ATCC 824 / DSM 792 / JCM 1419 / IAM 19013 / LMG 5710 / NBRC 13948 / NRRL B-527 / VKM B-1787 / 2291 / W) TaxID=272562 RepID=Q97JX8_CLOAB|nr:Hypothetical protein CA_C1145 [Clostridium acetobutylicum ATCC 824]ADZ20194.1 Conserved hypothetical protein [Clostridium acetobutylicum EA 2018]AEI31652.1 hypothetical protein SMB_G1164 [Clostridium acetobutylicum DSM 1731]AWV81629.1 hypothetical protein DK921_16330 [Clostridium acetobutylicum]PSM04914.1 hypothetical protein C7T89_16325 [Clostridium sp. NJ4]
MKGMHDLLQRPFYNSIGSITYSIVVCKFSIVKMLFSIFLILKNYDKTIHKRIYIVLIYPCSLITRMKNIFKIKLIHYYKIIKMTSK